MCERISRLILCFSTRSSSCAFCCCFVLGIVSCHILYMRPAKSHSWKSLLGQYKYLLTRVNQAERRYNRFVEASKQCAVSQEKVLRGILDHAKNTEHGLRYRFGEISTRDKFTREHPLTSYDFYRDYARRSIDEGEENLTVPDPILYFGITSGSSGKNKIYSLTDRGRLFRTDLLWFHTVKRHCLMNLGRHFYIKYASKSVRSKFGLPIGPASVFEYLVPIELSPVPNEVYYIDDEHVS
ncbi:uncharacterized protein LOC141904121 isoform X2 [Tubulanus polymorphus]|uniref:uncharacterized protein LOC141904121 isoform X2 n=1 Tax=Tubulanus polymorphus TaxID=672921 RepID=UPI003DA2962B